MMIVVVSNEWLPHDMSFAKSYSKYPYHIFMRALSFMTLKHNLTQSQALFYKDEEKFRDDLSDLYTPFPWVEVSLWLSW